MIWSLIPYDVSNALRDFDFDLYNSKVIHYHLSFHYFSVQNHNGGQRFARGSASSDTQAPQQQVTPPAAANGASDNMWC